MRFLRRGGGKKLAAEEPKPHMWVWDQEDPGGGTVRFLLRDDNLSDLTDADKDEFTRSFRETPEVFSVRLYLTYIAVQWNSKGKPATLRPPSEKIIATGLYLLARHCGWQGELRVGKIDELEQVYEVERKEGLQNRWRFGSY